MTTYPEHYERKSYAGFLTPKEVDVVFKNSYGLESIPLIL